MCAFKIGENHFKIYSDKLSNFKGKTNLYCGTQDGPFYFISLLCSSTRSNWNCGSDWPTYKFILHRFVTIFVLLKQEVNIFVLIQWQDKNGPKWQKIQKF